MYKVTMNGKEYVYPDITKVNISMESKLFDRLEAYCKKNTIHRNALLDKLIREELANKKSK